MTLGIDFSVRGFLTAPAHLNNKEGREVF